MIYGIAHRDIQDQVGKDDLFKFASRRPDAQAATTYLNRNVAVATSDTGVETIDDGTGLAFSGDKQIVVAASGNIYKNGDQDEPRGTTEVAKVILAQYEAFGENAFRSLNGQYAAAIWDGGRNRFVLARDHLGFEPLFYYWNGRKLLFSSSFKSLAKHGDVDGSFNFRAIRNYLLFNYNPGLDTFIRSIKKVRPGHCLILEKGQLRAHRYWYLSYQNQNGRRLDSFVEELLDLTKDAIRIRTQEPGSDPGAFLSGGMDSSSVVGLLSGLTDRPVHTFSFRCDDKYVDESHFARVMARHYHTQHNELEYEPDELNHLADMTEWMEEPLCDIGVELGSYILGRAARDKVKYILTGDGGDELYAGHPVYIADQMAEKFDRIPAPIRWGVTTLAGMLPDSEQKKSLRVKARRFAYSYGFPAELLSNRWRIYYADSELASLCQPDFVSQFGQLNSYEDITSLYSDADGPDHLSQSLYGDYQTLVHFHVDRLRLTRAWGIEARFPLHDYRLIDFSGTIPTDLKIKAGQVKYIQKKAMEGVLPDEIVFRKDKMGHNVPMKNWMRNTSLFRDLIHEVLSEEAIRKRNFFDSKAVQSMMELHLSKRKDFSHRLYALLVLELWMQRNLDG